MYQLRRQNIVEASVVLGVRRGVSVCLETARFVVVTITEEVRDTVWEDGLYVIRISIKDEMSPDWWVEDYGWVEDYAA